MTMTITATVQHLQAWAPVDHAGRAWDVRLDRIEVEGLPPVFRVDFWDACSEPCADADGSFAEVYTTEAAARLAVRSFCGRQCAGEVTPCERS